MKTQTFPPCLKGYLFTLFVFFFFSRILGQTVNTYNITGALVGGDKTYCKGDTVTLELWFNCVCGFDYLISTLYKNDGDCTPECEITERHTPRIQGPGIIWHSTPNRVNKCSGESSGVVSCKIIANETASYSIQWSKMTEYQALSPICRFDGKVDIYNYSASTTITVIDPKPTLSPDKTRVKPGEAIKLTVNNCLGGSGANFFIEEKCGLYSSTGICSNPMITFKAPSYSTSLMLRVRERTIRPAYCESDWSEYVIIVIEEEPNPDACNNSTIRDIEDNFENWDKTRSDFHNYDPHDNDDNNIVCNTTTGNCTLGEAWNLLKSNVYYQAPSREDFSDNPQFSIQKTNPVLYGIQPQNGKIPVSNCMEIELASVDMRVPASLLGLLPSVDVHLNDPVKIVIDETSKCITNYTLKGHILYPGKIRRCLVIDDCNNIKIETQGTGFHFLGDSLGGEYFANKNIEVGKHLFRQVDKRFIQAFKNR